MVGDARVLTVHLDPAARAVVFANVGQPLEHISVPEVSLHVGELLVAVELATICGSDLHTVLGHRDTAAPLVLGHEQVGHVAAIGPGPMVRDATGRAIKVGDRVIWSVTVSCGACRMCDRAVPNKCVRVRKYGHERLRDGWRLSGSMASHVHLLAGTSIVRVDERLPAAAIAPASCATATVAATMEAAATNRPLDGESVVIQGCGMLGLTAVAMAHERGARVTAVDSDAARRDLALKFGAHSVASPDDPIPAFDVGIELSGASDAVGTLLERASTGATVVLAGSVFPAPPIPLATESVVRRALTIRGVHNYSPRHLVEAVRFLRSADVGAFAALVPEVLPLSRAAEALSRPPRAGTRIGVRPESAIPVRP